MDCGRDADVELSPDAVGPLQGSSVSQGMARRPSQPFRPPGRVGVDQQPIPNTPALGAAPPAVPAFSEQVAGVGTVAPEVHQVAGDAPTAVTRPLVDGAQRARFAADMHCTHCEGGCNAGWWCCHTSLALPHLFECLNPRA